MDHFRVVNQSSELGYRNANLVWERLNCGRYTTVLATTVVQIIHILLLILIQKHVQQNGYSY